MTLLHILLPRSGYYYFLTIRPKALVCPKQLAEEAEPHPTSEEERHG